MTTFEKFNDMFQAYHNQGFKYVHRLTTAQRKEWDLKAHKVQEQLNVEFKYVPLRRYHFYMFSCEDHWMRFSMLCR